MILKLFTLQLTAEHASRDQEAINAFMDSVAVKQTATQFVPGNPDFWSILLFYEPLNGHKVAEPEKPVVTEADLNEEEQQIFAALRLWRKDKAIEINHPEYLVFHNATLISLAKEKPRTVDELSRIKGVGEQKIIRYGDDLMAILNAF
jgi:superfamily II DNA helicase RecQ